MRDTSPALIRFFGFLGFVVFGLASLQVLNRMFHLELDLWSFSLSDLGAKQITVIILSLILAFIGMVVGWGIGATVRVRSDRTESVINTVWHYGANGCVMWLILSGGALSLALGREGAKAFIVSFGGLRLFIVLAGIGLLGSWIIGFILNATTKAVMAGKEVGYLWIWLFAVGTSLCMSVAQSLILHIPGLFTLACGFFFPFILIPLTLHTKGRDERWRARMTDSQDNQGHGG